MCLFGLHTKEQGHSQSEADLAVLLNRLPSDLNRYKQILLFELVHALGTDTVEVVILNLTPTARKIQIYKDAQILYQTSPGIWPRFVLQTLQEFEITKNLRAIFDDYWIEYLRTQEGVEASAINKLHVMRYIGALRHYIKWLGLLQWHSLEEFLANEEIRWAVEHGLQLAVQCVVDIGIHILAGRNLARPENYHEVIVALGEQEIIPKLLADRIAYMADLQAMLIYMYMGVDAEVVFDVLQNNLADFAEFAENIVLYLEQV
jgi:uncharacterized protein YutE (UPF0331/DUF86 family)